MSDDTTNDGRQGDVRDRIASVMQALGQARPEEVSPEEAKKLRAAAERLDQMLKEFAVVEEARSKEAREQEARALRAAAGRLDSLLAGATGKGAMPELKLRRTNKEKPE